MMHASRSNSFSGMGSTSLGGGVLPLGAPTEHVMCFVFEATRQAEEMGVAYLRWRGTRLDVFVPSIDFYDEAKRPTRVRPSSAKGLFEWLAADPRGEIARSPCDGSQEPSEYVSLGQWSFVASISPTSGDKRSTSAGRSKRSASSLGRDLCASPFLSCCW